MKKLFSIFLAIIFIATIFSVCCFAENPVQLKLNSETDTVYAGDEFVVRLMISDNSKMSGAAIDVNYDKNKLEYVSGSFGGILDESATKSLKNIKGDTSKVRFTYLAPSSAVTSQGVLVVLKFRALENASGTTELSIAVPNPGDFVSQDLERLSYTVENTKVKILNSTSEIVTETETEVTTEETTESQKIETIGTIETTKPIENTTEENDGDDNTYIILLVSGLAILLIVFALANKSKKNKSKRKKKKGRR